jgi:hypothetical protein
VAAPRSRCVIVAWLIRVKATSNYLSWFVSIESTQI